MTCSNWLWLKFTAAWAACKRFSSCRSGFCSRNTTSSKILAKVFFIKCFWRWLLYSYVVFRSFFSATQQQMYRERLLSEWKVYLLNVFWCEISTCVFVWTKNIAKQQNFIYFIMNNGFEAIETKELLQHKTLIMAVKFGQHSKHFQSANYIRQHLNF